MTGHANISTAGFQGEDILNVTTTEWFPGILQLRDLRHGPGDEVCLGLASEPIIRWRCVIQRGYSSDKNY